MKNIFSYIEAIQEFFIFIFFGFSIYKITHFFTDVPSLFNKFSWIDIKDYDKPLFDETDLKIDSKKTEEIKVVLSEDEVKLDKYDVKSDQPAHNNIYMYCLNKFGTNVDVIADVAQKGLDESNEATKEATKAAIETLDKNEELLKEKQTALIKEIPKIKPKHFYKPPHRE